MGRLEKPMQDFAQLDRRGQMDIVHTAIFGWPLDQLSSTQELLDHPSLQDSTRQLLRSERVQHQIGLLAPGFDLLDRKAQLDMVHVAIFGWPLDDLSPVAELMNSRSLQEATHKLLDSGRVRLATRESVPLWPTDKWVCTDFLGLTIWVNLNDSYVARGVLDGDWENQEVGFALDQLRPGDTMVDVGANVGVYTLQAARAVGPEGRVYAFEPQTDIFAMLSRSVADNGFESRVVLENCAVGDRDGPAAIWRHHANNPGASIITADPVEGAGNVTALKMLDSIRFDAPVKLLKMDIEGFEPLLVAGAQTFLREHRPIIVTEWFPRAIRNVAGTTSSHYFDQLADLGYEIFMLDGRVLGAPFTRTDVARHEDVEEPFNIACMPRGHTASSRGTKP